MLKMVIEEMEMSQAAFAYLISISPKHLCQLIAGKVPLSYGVAEKLEEVTNVPGMVWMWAEVSYRLELRRRAREAKLE